jgi:hypothetical protein
MITHLLKSNSFNVLFSFLLGLGIICIIRPMCKGDNCNVFKAPKIKEFDGNVYMISRDCYEFKPEIVECPSSGTIEAFEEAQTHYVKRQSVINRCE